MSLNTKDKRGIVFALLGFSLFAIGDLFIKFLADDGFKPVEIAFFLNMFYLPFLLILSPIIGGIKATLRTNNLWLHVVRALLGVCIFIIIVNAFHQLGLSITYTLIFVAPFFSTILAYFVLKEEIHKHRWLAIILGFIGVIVVLRPWSEELSIVALSVIFAAILIAVNNLLIRRIGEDEPLMAFSLFGCIIALQVFGVMNFWDGEANIPSGQSWLLFFVIALFHTGGALLTARAFSIADTAVIAPFHYVQLLWGTGFGIIIFSNVPDIWTGLGALIIVFSGIYMIYRENVKNQHITPAITAHGGFEQDFDDEDNQTNESLENLKNLEKYSEVK